MMHRERHCCISTVNTGAARIHQVLNAVVAATFQDVSEADDVAVYVGERVLNGVTHSGLGSEVDHALGLVGGKALFNRLTVT